MQPINETISVAAYCRVSTDTVCQNNSLENQESFFENYIKQHPQWKLFRIYADHGTSGTTTLKRTAFNRMIEDAKNKKFSMIITKEISRFARNTLDSIRYTRELKKYGVGVIFLNDNINTLDPDSELRLTIMSSIAQEESRKISDRVKWGQRRMMEKGIVFGHDMLGYDVRNGKLFINEKGAQTVRLIFHKYLTEGKGTHTIAKELSEASIRTSAGTTKWSATAILRILKNEKYCGDLIQQKTYTPDYLNHCKKYNKGELDFVVITDHHPPVISKDFFQATQKEIQRRNALYKSENRFSNRYALSGKIFCNECGGTYVHRHKNGSDSNWVCIKNQKHGNKEKGCSCISVKDTDLQKILQKSFADSIDSQRNISDKIRKTIKSVLNSDTNIIPELKKEIHKINNKKQKLIDLYLSENISVSEYKDNSKKLTDEHNFLVNRLTEENRSASANQSKNENLIRTENHILSILQGKKWDDTFFRNITEKIVVHKNGEIEIYFSHLSDKKTALILRGKTAINSYNKNK